MSLKNVSSVVVTGNTFACRNAIRELGGRWDAAGKCWVIDIASHPANTMRGRGGLESALRALRQRGCRTEER